MRLTIIVMIVISATIILATSVFAETWGYAVRFDDDVIPTQSISAGEEVGVTVSPEGETHSFLFVPDESGSYIYRCDDGDYSWIYTAIGRIREVNPATGEVNEIYVPLFSTIEDANTFTIRFNAVKGRQYYIDTTTEGEDSEEDVSYTIAVVPDEYATVSYTPKYRMELEYEVDGDMYEDGFYYPVADYIIYEDLQGEFVFTRTDGTKEIYKYDENEGEFMWNGESLWEDESRSENWAYLYPQDEPWGLGKHDITVSVQGKSFTLPVWVVKEKSGRVEYDPGAGNNNDPGSQTNPRVSTPSISLSAKSLTLAYGSSKKLTASSTDIIKWKSSNKKVATVSNNGTIKAKKPGTAIITAYSSVNPKLKKTCKVTVKYQIKYNLKGGKNSSKNPKWHNGKKTLKLKNATRTGYKFKGWYKSKKLTKSITKKDKNVTLYAKWQAKKYKVSFSANGGKFTSLKKTRKVTYGKKYGNLPKVKRKGWKFEGWWTAKSGGKKVTKSTKMTTAKNQKLYAHWSKTFPVALYLNGGYDGTNVCNFKVTTGKKYSGLRTPIRAGYTFEGWWTAKSGGKKVTKNTVVKAGDARKLYARWKAKKNVIRMNSVANVSWEKTSTAFDIIKTGAISASKDGKTWYYVFSKKSGEVLIPVSYFSKQEKWSVPSSINKTLTSQLNNGKGKTIDFLIKKTELGQPPKNSNGTFEQVTVYDTTIKQMYQAMKVTKEDFYLHTKYFSDVSFRYTNKVKKLTKNSSKKVYQVPSTPVDYVMALQRTSRTIPVSVNYKVEMKNPGYYKGDCYFDYYNMHGVGVADDDVNVAKYVKVTEVFMKLLDPSLSGKFEYTYKTLFDLFGLKDSIVKAMESDSKQHLRSGLNVELTRDNDMDDDIDEYCYGYEFISPIKLKNEEDEVQFTVATHCESNAYNRLAGTNTTVTVTIK